MTIVSKTEVSEFVKLYNRFCLNIDRYNSLFELNEPILTQVKSESYFVNHFNEVNTTDGLELNFALKKFSNIKTDLTYLIQQCKNNVAYTAFIGAELGMETVVYNFYSN